MLASPPISADGLAKEFTTIYEAWFGTVHRWIRMLGGPEAEVEDLAQEVFAVVQRQLHRFDGRNLGGWLYRITERMVSDHRRRSWFRKIFLRPRDVPLESLRSQASDAEEALERKQNQERFYRLVSRMSAKWRNSFVLFEVGGYSGEDIASLEGIPAATVRVHLHRARKEFLALIAKEQRA